MAQNHLYLVDGSGYIFRAYHRLPPLTDPAGTPVGAVYGFTAMLWKLIEELNKAEAPTHLLVVFDAGAITFRNAMYDGYKAQRPPPPSDLVPQFPLIRDAVRAFSVKCIEQDGVEADDIIASYALAAKADGYNVTIVSSDKDLMQLVQPGIDMLDTMKNCRIDRAEVIAKFGVPPEQVGEVLALMGDSVDNIPGVRGVGPKGAAELIKEFGTVDALLSRLDEVKRPKLREMLTEHADNARMSRELVRLKDDLPLMEPLDALTLREPPKEPLAAFLAKHGFRALLSKLGRETEAAHAAPAKDTPDVAFERTAYECVSTVERLDWWIAAARQQGLVAVDTETDNLDATRANLIGFSLALSPGQACYVPLRHTSSDLLAEQLQQIDVADAIARLEPLFADPAVLKVGHDFKYDMIVFARAGAAPIAPYEDAMLMSYALDAGRWSSHGLEDLATRHLGHTPISYKEVTGTAKTRIAFEQVPLDRATEFAAEDVDAVLRLYEKFKGRMWREGATTVYRTVDRPLLPAVAAMEQAGIMVDRAALVELSALYEIEIASLETRIFEVAGRRFTIGSPKQLGEVLFDELGHASGKKSGKTGAFATDVVELERLAAGGVEIARMVLDWRQNTKLKSTYTDALQGQINAETGRVHTSFGLASTATGRMNSNDPNLQNIPIRTEMGRRIRHAFVAAPGNVLMSADYNQIELRLVAHIADVPELKQVYADGGDVHALTAQEVFGEVTRDTRNRAKTINFSIIYGISAFGLAQRLGIDRGEAARYIELYFSRFPGIRNYMAETIAAAKDQGFVQTLFGRKVHVPMIFSKQMGERQNAERAAVNARVQGTAADIIKRAMARMPGALAAAGLTQTRMLLQVHDELVFEVAEGEVAAATEVIRTTMAGAHAPSVNLSIPLGVEVGTGSSWGDAH